MKSRNYCFTLFFPSLVDAQAATIAQLPMSVKYIVYQVEQCPATARYHWQGYMELSSALRITATKQLHPLFAGMHLEKRNRTPVFMRSGFSRKRARRSSSRGFFFLDRSGGGA
eukprot:gene17255-23575_t